MHKVIVICDPDLEEIIPEYLDDRRLECKKIKSMARAGDFETIKTIAHGIKGSGGCYGFMMISTIGRDIEQAAKSEKTDEILRQAELLEEYLNRIEIQYQ